MREVLWITETNIIYIHTYIHRKDEPQSTYSGINTECLTKEGLKQLDGNLVENKNVEKFKLHIQCKIVEFQHGGSNLEPSVYYQDDLPPNYNVYT